MQLKGIQDEDFVNYKVPSIVLITSYCAFKCDKEYGEPICQNSGLAKAPVVDIDTDVIINRYLKNPITKAICLAGLEPFDQFRDVVELITLLRIKYHCDDMVVIYTGYNKDEIKSYISVLKQFRNITVKFGRYIPNQTKHYDDVLGIDLASDNQYAEVIS